MKIRRVEADPQSLETFLARSYTDQKAFEASVAAIAEEIRAGGETAVFACTERFDGPRFDHRTVAVSPAEIAEAYAAVGEEYLLALAKAIDNITGFHERQLKNSWMETDSCGNILGQVLRPLERVGVYVPGGTAAYPSSVLMNAIPALVAGVEEIVMVSPPGRDGKLNPYTLAAAAELGLREIYKVGGAQAVFMLGWGTEHVKKVDLISGPGNIYVTLAKKMVYGSVNIDMLAGPSEILIIADQSADPAYLAADMMSQAEHDVLARSVLVTDQAELLQRVEDELNRQIEGLSRKQIIAQSLESYGAFILVEDLEAACAAANRFAPEHLELMVDRPFDYLSKIRNAGAIFLGANTPEPLGDYLAGPNHILPTGGTARFYSPVTVDTFMKTSSLIYYTREGLLNDAEDTILLAGVEGLTAHANSIRVRVQS
jgi:histidinol dehydrogenase